METLSYSIDAGVATVSLDRPQHKNALNRQMVHELTEVIGDIKNDTEIGCVVISGKNNAFCSGGDLGSFDSSSGVGESYAKMSDVANLAKMLHTLSFPIVTAVNGAAFGAGFSLALVGDYILATERSIFCMSFGKVGLIPDMGSLYSLPRIVGPYRARQIMLSTKALSAQDAEKLGIVYRVFDNEESLMTSARKMAADLASASPDATRIIKSTLKEGHYSNLDGVLEMEAGVQAVLSQSEYFKEAVGRFMNKQPSLFEWSE